MALTPDLWSTLPIAAFDIDKLVDVLGPLFVIVFFFLVPIVRTIRENLKQARERQAGTTTARESDPEVEAGRRAWEDLLRGDAPATTRAPASTSRVPPPVPVSSSRPTGTLVESVEGASYDAAGSREGSESASRQTLTTGPLTDLGATPTEDEEEESLDEERVARERNEQALREEFERRNAFLQGERERAARKTVAPLELATLEQVPAESSSARPVGATQRVFGRRLDRATLRRAFVASEILGRPVAFRGPDDEAGTFALRRGGA